MNMFNSSQSQENRLTAELQAKIIRRWNLSYYTPEATQRAMINERPDLWSEPRVTPAPAEHDHVATLPSQAAAEVIDLAVSAEQKTIGEQQRFINASRQAAEEAYESAA